MRVSLNTVNQYIDFELPPVEELVSRINEQLGGVEETIDLADKYKDAVIVKVVSCEKHPAADRLNVCRVDDGGVTEDVDRGEDGLVQVVCGAPNVKADMYAVWLPPRSVVPSSYGDDSPFVLGARDLRGVMSQGMLAAGDELALNSDHDGIIEIHPEEPRLSTIELRPGASFAACYGLDDTIIDIENKMFTHRPDLFGQLGVAREIAGIFGHEFKDPSWYYELEDGNEPTKSFELTSFNECAEKVPRFMVVGMDNITVGPSPLWLQAKLVALGSKPINNVVDITNYVMLMSAQPLHAYDYDKLRGATIGARFAKDEEIATLLNGKQYKLTTDDIVIADGEGVIGLGGIMGGGDSEVSDSTRRIVLECASFDMYTIRKTAMRHGIFTEAVTRFNKGQSMLMNPYVAQVATAMLKDIAGAKLATQIYDDLLLAGDEWRARPSLTPMLKSEIMSTDFINKRLGLKLTTEEILTLLRNVGFECESKDSDKAGEFSYWSPAWRMDINDKEDIVEEIGRLYGFDKLPRELPIRRMKPAMVNPVIVLKQKIRAALATAGANEILTYSFVHENVLRRADQNPDDAYRLSNALSPDLQFYRLSITPSLLDKVSGNMRAGHDAFALFEIGKAHSKQSKLGADGLPLEFGRIGLTFASKNLIDGAAYFQVKSLLEYLADKLGLELAYKPLPETTNLATAKAFDAHRSARIIDVATEQPIGIIGEYSHHVKRGFKLPEIAAGFELFLDGLMIAIENVTSKYAPLSKYPSIERDVTFVCTQNESYAELEAAVGEAIALLDVPVGVHLRGVYQSPESNNRHVTFVFTLKPEEQTLTGQRANELIASIVSGVEQNTKARVIL